MPAYYNEIEPFAAAWLRELIKAGLLAPGDVDERSIEDVRPADLKGYTQCHFFAGIGGWSYALRIAGWSDYVPAWTGSCPCQPLSCAGQRKGHADKRHLWPAFYRLIAECKPPVVFGEQVASALGREWFAGVRADLEAVGYACGGSDLCAACVSAPHIRQRLYWVADAEWNGGRADQPRREEKERTATWRIGQATWMVNADGHHRHWWSGPLQVGWNSLAAEIERGGRKYRAQWRIKPGLSILADGVPARVEQLCGFGNAIVPQVAAEFILAYREIGGQVNG